MEQYLIGLILIVILGFFIGIPSIMFCCICNQKRNKNYMNKYNNDKNNIEQRKSLLALNTEIA